MEKWMRSLLSNKNGSLYYWLKKRIGERGGFRVANSIGKVILFYFIQAKVEGAFA